MWTTEEIRSRIAISTAVFQNVRLSEREIASIKASGIDQVEISIVRRSFDDRDAEQVRAVLEACRKQDVTVVSVHGPFDLPYRDSSPEAEDRVIEGSLESIRFAQEAGAGHYVGHFGIGEGARRVLSNLIEQTEGLGIVLTTENQTGQPLKPYDEFVEEMNEPRVSWTLDIGHARDGDQVNPFVKAGSERVLVSSCRKIGHTHLHDSFDLEEKSDHRPPMHRKGLIRWGGVFQGFYEIDYDGRFVFEDGRGEDPEEWVRHAATFPKRFRDRYQADNETNWDDK
jgi:sugar phosphate isomerase/epimerase